MSEKQNQTEYGFFTKLNDFYSPEIDPFMPYANDLLNQLPLAEQDIWRKILHLAKTATDSKPSAKFLKEMNAHIQILGEDKFKTMIFQWFEFIIHTKEEWFTHPIYEAIIVTLFAIHDLNRLIIKGLVWACASFGDQETSTQIATLALHAYDKNRYAVVGNACCYALYRSGSMDGVAQLSRLRVRVKSSPAQKLIAKYLDEIAAERGVSRDEIEDLAVDDFGLVNHCRDWQFHDYTCRVQISGVGKSDLLWLKPDGSLQKSAPAFMKDEFADDLKQIKALQKNLNAMLTAQRDRLDQLLRSERRVSLAHAQDCYWQHDLMSWLTLPLIWQFYQDDTTENATAALCLNGVWVNELGETVDVSGSLKVGLWHPVLATQESVLNWRNLLIKHEIMQPLKQAFREIYVLTEAEINTRTYSNRFAAHILKQHQYMTLAKGRGWAGRLSGYEQDDAKVWLKLPEYDLEAQFWAAAAFIGHNDISSSGMNNFVSTDQVRFMRGEQVLNLVDIPQRIFSEVLRDVDLFVGVASVGNDPTWQDNGGEPRYQQYWQAYSFGDLNEMAKTRKSVLEMLLPRLKIGKVAHIDGNFLVVQGKLRTYKIHIGSTNILMLPNDQYLCIVPDRSKKDVTSQLFIPFEGDAALSVVLSKAMLLADDDKITDSSIVSQIKRK